MINIAILGYGVVGTGVAEVCRMNRDYIAEKTGRIINLKKILDIRDFPGDPFEDKITKNADEIFDDPEISVIVETIGGTGIAYEFTKRALNAGKSVVTSNKELVATHGPELLDIAASKKISYLFEASVGGGIPIIRPLNKCLSGNRVKMISGILNGTTNYILTGMMKLGISFEKALREAQSLGYAEQNPVSDIEGTDACRKLAILASIVTGEFIDYRNIYTEGISKVTSEDMTYATKLGYKIKLVAQIRQLTGLVPEAIVAPMLLSASNPLAVADDVYNAIIVEGNALGPSMFYGRGAGKMPTASAIIADVIEAVLHINLTPHRITWSTEQKVKIREHGECTASVFIRIKDSVLSRNFIQNLKDATDIEVIEGVYAGEFAIIAGSARPMTEKALRELSLPEELRLSMIRIYTDGSESIVQI
ncbi:MAG: homoserine dehydrogenase [Saccharofermentanales bacterium]